MDVSKYLGDREAVAYSIESKAMVWIKPVSPRRIEEVSDAFTTHRARGGRVIARTDERAVALKLIDESVERWENIEDEDGPIECNATNKVRLYDLWPMFRRVWQEAVFGDYNEELPEATDLEGALEGN